MQTIKVSELKPHPLNSKFFDDITGDSWNLFLESIQTSGVIEPIIATDDKVIVSGHQRARACRQLNIEEVPVVFRSYDTSDDVIKDLIETNIRQRGCMTGSPVKIGRCIKELERIYGIRQGKANERGIPSSSIGTSREFTQADLAKQLGIDLNTLKRAKALSSLPQEIQDMIEDGKITPSTASRVIARLSPDEQLQLIEELPVKDKYTQKEIERLTSELTESKRLNSMYEDDMHKLNEKNAGLINSQPVQQYNKPGVNLGDDCIFVCAKIDSFLKDLGGYAYITNHMSDLSDVEWKQFITAIQSINAWSSNILHVALEKENANG